MQLKPTMDRWIDRSDAWLTPRRIMRYPAVLLGLTLGLYAFTLSGAQEWTTAEGRVIGEDYLAFYMAGEMVRSGDAEGLYDLAAQASWQRRFMADRNPRWTGTCLFLNPPHYAWAMSLFTGWGYGPSLVAWWVLAVGCFAVTGWIWRGWLPAGGFRPTVLLAVGLPAWFQAFAGGQNSFLSLLVLTAFCGLLMRGRDLLAGLVLTLLAFKFQLLIVPLGLLVYQRRWAALGGLALGGLATAGFTLATLGGEALGNYLQFGVQLSGLLQLDGFDVYKQHSWHGFFALLGTGWLTPAGIRALSVAAGLVTLALLVSIWRGPWTRERLPLVLSATMVGNLLISPHLFHYDLVILTLPAVLWVSGGPVTACPALRRQFRVLLALGFAWLAISPLMAEALHVQLSPWLMCAWLGVALRAARAYAGTLPVSASMQVSDGDDHRSAAIDPA